MFLLYFHLKFFLDPKKILNEWEKMFFYDLLDSISYIFLLKDFDFLPKSNDFYF